MARTKQTARYSAARRITTRLPSYQQHAQDREITGSSIWRLDFTAVQDGTQTTRTTYHQHGPDALNHRIDELVSDLLATVWEERTEILPESDSHGVMSLLGSRITLTNIVFSGYAFPYSPGAVSEGLGTRWLKGISATEDNHRMELTVVHPVTKSTRRISINEEGVVNYDSLARAPQQVPH